MIRATLCGREPNIFQALSKMSCHQLLFSANNCHIGIIILVFNRCRNWGSGGGKRNENVNNIYLQVFSNIQEKPCFINDKYSAWGKIKGILFKYHFPCSPPHLTFLENISPETQNFSIKWPSIYTAEINISVLMPFFLISINSCFHANGYQSHKALSMVLLSHASLNCWPWFLWHWPSWVKKFSLVISGAFFVPNSS